MKTSLQMKKYFDAISSAVISLFCLFFTIQANAQADCNTKAVDSSIAKKIPVGVCVPNGLTVDLVVSGFDFNQDGMEDFAVRCTRYPLQDGNMRQYIVYERVNDSVLVEKQNLSKINFPYISHLTSSYLESHKVADSLVRIYPVDTKVKFVDDTISISHIIPDFFGKTYNFVYDVEREGWYLKNVKFWIGELPLWLVRNGDLDERLLNERIVLEEKVPTKEISIDEFDIFGSKRMADTEESAYFMDNYDVFELGAKK